MVRKLALAALLLLAIGPASGQNTVCPTRPNGDDTNACASTAFVQNAFSGGSSVPASSITGILGLAHGGTGSNLSATGGANQFVKQSGAGANFSVGAITGAELPSPFTSGTRSGNTSEFATVSGAVTSGHFAKFDASGNLVDGGTTAGLGYFYVTDYGAVADGISGSGTDNTGPFQTAINAASAVGGGVVFVPNTGNNCFGFGNPGYLFLLTKVELLGTSTNASFKRAEGGTKGTPGGSVLCPTDTNAGNIFIRFGNLSAGAYGGMGVNGLTFYYPNQTETNPPVAYPPTIGEPVGYPVSSLTDTFVVNSVFMNSYKAMYFPSIPKSRMVIQNVTGEFLNNGILIDNMQDFVQIINVYDEVYVWSANTNVLAYMLANKISLDLYSVPAQVDHYTAEHGFALLRTNAGAGAWGGATQGSFHDLNMDDCNNGALINATANGGLLMSDITLVCTQNGIGIDNAGGNVSITNLMAWGNFQRTIYQTGSGSMRLVNANINTANSDYGLAFDGGSGFLSNITIGATFTGTTGAIHVVGSGDYIISGLDDFPTTSDGNINIVAPGAGISNLIFTGNICRATNSIPVTGSGVVKANNLGTC